MADIKTHLRELSVATTIGLLKDGIAFEHSDLYDSKTFLAYAKSVVLGDLSGAENLKSMEIFSGVFREIVDNGYALGKAIFNNSSFSIPKEAKIIWQGNDTKKEDPVDIVVGEYGFSLKEESFILGNMGLYKLLNCYTGANYKHRHIFSDYARSEYEKWFDVTWKKLLSVLCENNGEWHYKNEVKRKDCMITLRDKRVILEYLVDGKLDSQSVLPYDCSLTTFEMVTSSKTREQVFSKLINVCIDGDEEYNEAKRNCAIAASEALAKELNQKLRYDAGLPEFLRIHKQAYYYAKTTKLGIEIYKVPAVSEFGKALVIESICGSVPDKQANILTTIKNLNTGKTLVLRNECRFSHGQFNGTPEAKMYYEHGGSLEVIYEKLQ